MNRQNTHLNIGKVKRSEGFNIAGRLAYQGSYNTQHVGKRYSYASQSICHQGTVILAPVGTSPRLTARGQLDADRRLITPSGFQAAVLASERRCDSQEARTLNIAIPRAIPQGLELLSAAWALLAFVEKGMIAVIDVHRLPATDDKAHPHIHASLSLRDINGDGFGDKKNRSWNRFFDHHQFRHVRCLIASRLTSACALLGQEAFVDPRRKEHWSVEPVEPRLSKPFWRARDRGEIFPEVEEVLARRAARAAFHLDEEYDARYAVISNPALAQAMQPNCKASKPARLAAEAALRQATRQLLDTAHRAGFLPVNSAPDRLREEVEHLLSGTRIAIDQFARLTIDVDHFGPANWDCLADFLRAAGWPAMVVEDSPVTRDELGKRLLPAGLSAIDRPAGPETLAYVSENGIERMLSDIAPYDPHNVVAGLAAIFTAQFVKPIPVKDDAPALSAQAEAGFHDFLIEEFPTPPSIVRRPEEAAALKALARLAREKARETANEVAAIAERIELRRHAEGSDSRTDPPLSPNRS
jgi:hypothetical protein